MEKYSEIKGAIASFRNDTSFIQVRKRLEDDYNLWRHKPYNAGQGYYSYTSNYPRVLADKVIAMLTEANLMIHVPEELLDEKNRTIANNIERYLYGSFNLNDEKFLRLPGMPTLRGQMAWYATIRGGFALKAYVYKNDKGDTIPDVDIWDIYNTSYDKDDDGVTWAAHTYKITPTQAKKSYEYAAVGGKDIECVNFCDREKYGLFIGEKLQGEWTYHKLDYCPVYILHAGSAPIVWQMNYQYPRKHTGDSVFGAIRELMPIVNKTLSDWVTLVRRGVKVPMGVWTASGDSGIEEDIWQVEKAAKIELRHGDKIEPIMPQTMPQDATPLLNWMSGELQRGGLPHTAFGELGFRLSGFAINQLQASLSTVVAPFAECIERAYTVASLSLLEQYSKGSFKPVKVRGRTSRDVAFGFAKVDEIKSSDIKGDWHPEIKLIPVLPKDDAQRYQLAQLAREGEIPLLADRTIRTDLIGVKDSDLEAEKIDQEWGEKLVINRLYKAYIAAVSDGKEMEAQNILAELRRIMAQMMPQQQGGQAQGLSPSGQEALGSPGAGLPVRKTGVPSSTLPPETQGGFPPGAMNARIEPTATEEV